MGSEAEELLWRSLRDLGAERRCFMHVSDEIVEVDFAIVRGSRTIGVICGDDVPYEPKAAAGEWSVLRFSQSDVKRDLHACVQEIMQMLHG